MSYNEDMMKIAEISAEDVDSINRIQSKIKTVNDKDVVLIAYEK